MTLKLIPTIQLVLNWRLNAEVQKGIRDFCSMDSTQSIMTQCVIAILWNGESGSPVLTLLKLRWHPWKPSSMAETEKHALRNSSLFSQLCESGLRSRAVLLHGPLGLSGDNFAPAMSPVRTEEGM